MYIYMNLYAINIHKVHKSWLERCWELSWICQEGVQPGEAQAAEDVHLEAAEDGGLNGKPGCVAWIKNHGIPLRCTLWLCKKE